MSELAIPGPLASSKSDGVMVPGSALSRRFEHENAAPPESGYTARAILAILNRHKCLILGCISVVTLLMAVVAFSLSPTYVAEAMVILDTRRQDIVQQPAVISNLVSGSMADPAIVRSEVVLLGSQAYARKIIERLDLLHNATFKRENEPSALTQKISDVTSLFRKLLSPYLGHQEPIGDQSAMGRAIVDLQRHLTVYNDDRSYAISLRYDSPDPEFATMIVNTLAQLYLTDQLDNRLQVTQKAVEWLKARLGALQANARVSARKVAEFEEQNHIETVLGGNITEQRLHELISQHLIAVDNMARREAALNQARQMLQSPGGVAAAAQTLSSPLIEKLREQEAEIAARNASLKGAYRSAFPNGDPRTQEYEQKIGAEVQRIVAGLAEDVNAAKAQVATLQSTILQEQLKLSAANSARVELVQLQHEATANQNLYDTFLVRAQQVEADAQSLDAGVRVVAAEPPVTASFPKKGLLIAFGFFSSCFLGVLLAFVADQMDETIRTPDEAARLTGIPTFGVVPHVRNGNQGLAAIVRSPLSVFTDAINGILIALRAGDRNGTYRVVAFSSAVPDEGKTLIAAAVGRAAATTGARTLLIDCDMRRPTVGDLFGHKGTSALDAMFKQKSVNLASFVQTDEASGLHYLPAGRTMGSPKEILGSPWLSDLIAKASAEYDLVLVDTPPLLAVSDALLVARLAEVTLLVVRWGHTPGGLVSDALRQLQLHGKGAVGTVLSLVNLRKYQQYKRGAGYFGRYFSRHLPSMDAY
jgi:succinoglycan biosynthesis transport protein ExoP